MADMTTRDDTSFNLSLFKMMVSRKKTILVSMIVFFALAVWYMRTHPPVFTAKFTVDVLEPEERFSGQTQFGITIARPRYSLSDDMMIYYQLFSSQKVFDRAIDHYGLARTLYPEWWDPRQERWIQPTGLRTSIRRFLNTVIGRNLPENGPDNNLFIADKIRQSLSFMRGPGRLLRISFDYEDPAVAIRVLQALHQATTDEIRQSRLQSALNIVRLMKAGYDAETNVITRKDILDEIIYHEERAMVMSYNETPVISAMGDPSLAQSPIPSNPVYFLVASLCAGAIVGAVLNLLIFILQKARARQIRLYSRHSGI